MKIHIKKRPPDRSRNGIDARKDVYVAAGRSFAIGRTPPKGFTANRVIDATGLIVCPGCGSPPRGCREPGFEYMATLESEMEAPYAGGVTTSPARPIPNRAG